MFASLRITMAWVHTWFGIALSSVLMICFFFGALSVFDREFDRWAVPQTRFAPQVMPSFDKVLLPALKQKMTPGVQQYEKYMPELHDASKGPMTPRLALPLDEFWAYTTHRDPVLRTGTGYRVPLPKDPELENHIHGSATIDPRNGEIIADDALKIGSRWFYPMHYRLNLSWQNIGYWLVGLAAMIMMAALVSGLVMHRKILREFFTFRPEKSTQRSVLDLHNLSGVVALPFHFFFALTGMIVFASWLYFPVGHSLLKPLHGQGAVQTALQRGLPTARAGIDSPLASVDAMVTHAKSRWAERDMAGEVGFLQIHYFGDQNSYVSIFRAGSDRVALVGQGIHFRASDGTVLYENPPSSVISATTEFLVGLHLQHFEHWPIRWLYLLGGLLGCVCIATGFIFFVEKRKRQHAKRGLAGARIVDALAVSSVTGMVIAAVAILVANRLVPETLSNASDWQIAAFWAAWVLAVVHAALRSGPVAQGRMNPAWSEQCWAIAILATSAVALNWITTGDHLIRTLFIAPYWPVAGIDLCLLVVAVGCALTASRLDRRAAKTAELAARLTAHNTHSSLV